MLANLLQVFLCNIIYKEVSAKTGTSVNMSDFIKMQKHVEKQDKIIEILRIVKCTFSSPLKDKLYELEKLHGKYSVRSLCDALGVARGTYYNHVLRNKKKNNSYKERRDRLSEQILMIFENSNQVE